MCVATAKYFKDLGWVIAKNRDQDYVSDTSFVDTDHHHVGEIMVMYDKDIKYREGMNYMGMSIITTSLTPIMNLETNKSDGDHIYHALEMYDPEKAANYLISKKLTGFIFIATKDKLILIEAAKEDDGKGKYQYTRRIVPKSEVICRTNHGVDLKWAGFQSGIDETQDFWRNSSEHRMQYGLEGAKKATDPVDMLDKLAARYDSNLQMNVFRCEEKPRQMRTIFQWALVPSEDRAYIRPIQARMKIKVDFEKIHIETLDNEPIKKLYGSKLKHFCRVKEIDGGKEIKTVQTESFKNFYR